jgi:hypothetical protein
MSETKHTPGPWTLETVETQIGSCHRIGPFPSLGARAETYACVYADAIPLRCELKTGRELLANARLIHASPELLAYAVAEQTLRDTTEYSPNAHGELRKALGVPDEFKCIGDYLDALRKAAIAKATLPLPR